VWGRSQRHTLARPPQHGGERRGSCLIPRLLAARAVRNGNGSEGMGHLLEDARQIDACSFLFEE
jgi:hypothetical protein